MEQTIQVNFNKPMPLFPLADLVLLPHAVQHLHIFEKRYRQMVRDVLDSAGQIAMASFSGSEWQDGDDPSPDLRPAVCVGQIIHHHRLADGRYDIVLLGICRARILDIDEPTDARLYRQARLQLLEQADGSVELEDVRQRLRGLLQRPSLSTVRGLSKVVQLFEREDVPTNALVELIASTLVEDPHLRYDLLAEPNIRQRARILDRELRHIDALVRAASTQLEVEWPKGQSWN